MKHLIYIGFLMLSLLGCQKDRIPSKALYNEKAFRLALSEIEPELETVSYLFDGHVIFALLRRGDSEKYLLVLQPNAVGAVNVSIDGVEKAFHLYESLEVSVPGLNHNSDGTSEDNWDLARDFTMGVWLDIPNDAELRVEGSISHPAERRLEMVFTPPNTISTTLLPEPEQCEQVVTPKSSRAGG